MKSLVLVLALVLLPIAGSAAPQSAEPASPGGAKAAAASSAAAARAVVEHFHDVLIRCMKEADALGFQGRYDRILASLDEGFDMAFMARTSVGAAWKTLDGKERADFVDQSRRLSASKYANNFDGYGGERFETLSDEPAARSTIWVKTRLIQVEGDDVGFDYRLRDTASGWRIIDVQLDGKVSEITLRRADYRSAIKRKGFPQLVGDIEKKIEKLSKE